MSNDIRVLNINNQYKCSKTSNWTNLFYESVTVLQKNQRFLINFNLNRLGFSIQVVCVAHIGEWGWHSRADGGHSEADHWQTDGSTSWATARHYGADLNWGSKKKTLENNSLEIRGDM